MYGGTQSGHPGIVEARSSACQIIELGLHVEADAETIGLEVPTSGSTRANKMAALEEPNTDEEPVTNTPIAAGIDRPSLEVASSAAMPTTTLKIIIEPSAQPFAKKTTFAAKSRTINAPHGVDDRRRGGSCRRGT